ncbi:MAG: hypothetical protein KTR31_34940 [Myxococcales bacterium]|nr:hypothetical protein [Myxococcales bacterium]
MTRRIAALTLVLPGCLAGSPVPVAPDGAAIAATDTHIDVSADTGSDADTTTADTGSMAVRVLVATGLAFEAVGDSPDCLAKWDVMGTPSSHTCPDCDFTLSWQLQVAYTWSPDSTTHGCKDSPDPNGDAPVLNYTKNYQAWTDAWNTSYNWWAHTSDLRGTEEAVALGSYEPNGAGIVLLNEYFWEYAASWNQSTGELTFVSQTNDVMQGSGYVVEATIP